jgi:hypothetical protein
MKGIPVPIKTLLGWTRNTINPTVRWLVQYVEQLQAENKKLKAQLRGRKA